MRRNDSVSPSLVLQPEEPLQQSAIGVPASSRFGAFLSEVVTAVETEELADAPAQQSRTFDDDDPSLKVSISGEFVGSEVDTKRMALISKLQESTVDSKGSAVEIAAEIMNTVFIADIMNKKRLLDREKFSGRSGVEESLHDSDMNLDNFENKELRRTGGKVCSFTGRSSASQSAEAGSVLTHEPMVSNVHRESGTGNVSAQTLSQHHSFSVRRNLSDGGCKLAGNTVKHNTSVEIVAHSNSVGNLSEKKHHHQTQPQFDECRGGHLQSSKSVEDAELVVPIGPVLMNATMDCAATAKRRRGQIADCEENVELGGAMDRDMGHKRVKFAPTNETDLHSSVVNYRGGDTTDDGGDIVDTMDGAVESAVGSSASTSSSSNNPLPVHNSSSSAPKLARQTKRHLLRVAKKRIAQAKRRSGDTMDEEIDAFFKGDLPLHQNECYGELDADKKVLELAFAGLVEEYFPAKAAKKNSVKSFDSGTQLIYLEEDEGDVHKLNAFTANVRELLSQGRTIWLVLDTGANQHVIKDVALLRNKKGTFHRVTGVSGGATQLDCSGEVTLQLQDLHGNSHSLHLGNVFGLAKCPFNLASVNKL